MAAANRFPLHFFFTAMQWPARNWCSFTLRPPDFCLLLLSLFIRIIIRNPAFNCYDRWLSFFIIIRFRFFACSPFRQTKTVYSSRNSTSAPNEKLFATYLCRATYEYEPIECWAQNNAIINWNRKKEKQQRKCVHKIISFFFVCVAKLVCINNVCTVVSTKTKWEERLAANMLNVFMWRAFHYNSCLFRLLGMRRCVMLHTYATNTCVKIEMVSLAARPTHANRRDVDAEIRTIAAKVFQCMHCEDGERMAYRCNLQVKSEHFRTVACDRVTVLVGSIDYLIDANVFESESDCAIYHLISIWLLLDMLIHVGERMIKKTKMPKINFPIEFLLKFFNFLLFAL